MTIKHQILRRIRVTGPVSEKKAAWDYLYRNGYRATHCGPRLIRSQCRVDDTQFLIIAEREESK